MKCNSEYTNAETVIVHRPDPGINRITPEMTGEFLFADTIFLEKMQKEHDTFVNVIKTLQQSVQIYDIKHLLRETIELGHLTKKLIKLISIFEEMPIRHSDSLRTLSAADLAEVLITGHSPVLNTQFFAPLPNLIFTRDIACTINDHIIIGKATKNARSRESVITQFVIYGHEVFNVFQQNDYDRIINMNRVDEFPPSRHGRPVGLECGDLLLINKDTLITGISQRTTPHALALLRARLFSKGVVSNILEIDLRPFKFQRHLDTLLKQTDYNDYVGYRPMINGNMSPKVKWYNKDPRNFNEILNLDIALRQVCHTENINWIWAGDDIWPIDLRESNMQAINVLNVAPGIVLAYNRNVKTTEAFKKAGYEKISAKELLNKVETTETFPLGKKLIVTIPSGELSRGMGGPHSLAWVVNRYD